MIKLLSNNSSSREVSAARYFDTCHKRQNEIALLQGILHSMNSAAERDSNAKDVGELHLLEEEMQKNS